MPRLEQPPATEPMTLRRFFFAAVDAEGAAGALEAGREVDELREELKKQLGGVKWKMVAREIGKQVVELLDFGVAEKVLAPAWQRLEMLQEYRDPELHPPEESALVPLVEHQVVSTHEPHIDLMLKDTEIGRLTFRIELTLDLEGVVLRVRDGRIQGVEAGSATGRGSLACGYRERQLYSLERESSFQLEAGLSFAAGIPIPDLGGEAADAAPEQG